MMSDKELNELGRIAYGAACLATGCKQSWDEANQGKWIAAAKAVQTLVRKQVTAECDGACRDRQSDE